MAESTKKRQQAAPGKSAGVAAGLSENRRPEKKQHAGLFKKGQSGNPGGRPKGLAEVQDLARRHTPEAIKTLAALMKIADSSSAQVAACKELLDRAWGKAPQSITGEIALHDLTDEQLEARFLALTKGKS